MDNLTHTLVGLSLAETGLKRSSRLATATLVIGSNLPDVDAFSYAWGADVALATRRGITHGLPALVLWPFLLTAAMAAWDRWRGNPVGERRPFDRRVILLAAASSIWLHPLLDTLNNYGVRWLMPMHGRWFYGDTWFIVEPIVWATLGAGWWWARRRGSARPVWTGLALSAAFALLMLLGTVAGEARVRRELAAAGIHAQRIMVSPVPLNPLGRFVIAEDEANYYTGNLSLWPHRFDWQRSHARRQSLEAAPVVAALRSPAARHFLVWARFPYAEPERIDGDDSVVLGDLRYTAQQSGPLGRLVIGSDQPR